ncbi:BZ3500_MvSof-1268-A1-R1_Chr9g10623 [Microbotryum saponariae]|uniref:BZ3500_MvSof-1268-A1-R1_Chr9g10623 protein n=1 Tax=Microbotryum saponariae TaxID=289078 RepID=A0A2X0K9K7_9BASI|nr:BZ3501_MvSof-1269-A2-R1_Chr9g10371 [Microbotryum saponariae]SDA00404.1 BZ3500_MvSof-1268-A1-R1_Chr9g10623 [Microbotryum saponariae]
MMAGSKAALSAHRWSHLRYPWSTKVIIKYAATGHTTSLRKEAQGETFYDGFIMTYVVQADNKTIVTVSTEFKTGYNLRRFMTQDRQIKGRIWPAPLRSKIIDIRLVGQSRHLVQLEGAAAIFAKVLRAKGRFGIIFAAPWMVVVELVVEDGPHYLLISKLIKVLPGLNDGKPEGGINKADVYPSDDNNDMLQLLVALFLSNSKGFKVENPSKATRRSLRAARIEMATNGTGGPKTCPTTSAEKQKGRGKSAPAKSGLSASSEAIWSSQDVLHVLQTAKAAISNDTIECESRRSNETSWSEQDLHDEIAHAFNVIKVLGRDSQGNRGRKPMAPLDSSSATESSGEGNSDTIESSSEEDHDLTDSSSPARSESQEDPGHSKKKV